MVSCKKSEKKKKNSYTKGRKSKDKTRIENEIPSNWWCSNMQNKEFYGNYYKTLLKFVGDECWK